jgi:hypothetical protein
LQANEKLAAAKIIINGASVAARIDIDYYMAYTFCSLCVELLGNVVVVVVVVVVVYLWSLLSFLFDCQCDILGIKFSQDDAPLWESEHNLIWDIHDILLQCHKERGEVRQGNKIIQQLGRNAKTKTQTV